MTPSPQADGSHRAPWECVFAKDDPSPCHPGELPDSDQQLFEIFCLCLLQAGLNWGSIRRHWPRYRQGFLDFDIDRLAAADADALLQDRRIIRNRRKVEALVANARTFQRLSKEHGSVVSFLDTLQAAPGDTAEALAAHFRHVGPETAGYFLHSVGLGG